MIKQFNKSKDHKGEKEMNRFLISGLLALMSMASLGHAQDSSRVTKLAQFEIPQWRNVSGIDVVGTKAYIGTSSIFFVEPSSGFCVVDLDVSPWRVIGNCPEISSAHSVTVIDEFAFVTANTRGFYAINISDERNPRVVGNIELPHYASNFCIRDNFAYLAVSDSGLVIVDIDDPEELHIIGSIPSIGRVNDVEIMGNFAFLADDSAGLVVVDISTPHRPRITGRLESPVHGYSIEISGNFVFLADENHLRVIDITEPNSPGIVSQWEYQDRFGLTGVFINGHYLYLQSQFWGDNILDISDPANLVVVGRLYDFSDIAFVRDRAYCTTGQGASVRELDISDPTHPTTLTTFSSPGITGGSIINGDFVYLTGSNGPTVVNLQDPANPELVGSFNHGQYDLAVKNGYLYSSVSHDISISRLEDPSHPVWIRDFRIEGGKYPHTLAISGSYLYAACGWDGISIIDLTDPEQLVEAAVCTLMTSAGNIEISGDYLYVNVQSDTLVIFDITDPVSPERVYSLRFDDHLRDIRIIEDRLYLLGSNFGVVVYDIGNPASPVRMGILDLDWVPSTFEVFGNFAILAYGWSGFQIFDVSDPLAIRRTGYYTYAEDYDKKIYGFAMVNDRVLAIGNSCSVYDGSDALSVSLPSPLPPSTFSLSAFPNPFNSSTTINYSLPSPGRYAIEVIDIQGRLVTRLADGWREAGSYREVFDGNGLTTGNYFLQIENGNNKISRPITLIK